MARLPRLTLAGHLHHVLQLGNNRQPVFIQDQDRVYFLDLLEALAKAHQVSVLGFVLMEDHFHLLLIPQTANGLPLLMQALGRRYVREFNARHGRSGTLWAGRFRSTLLDPAELLSCLAYFDLNPVRSGWVDQAQDYCWSSHRHYAGLETLRLLTPPQAYWALGNTPFAREAAYILHVQNGLSANQEAALTRAVRQGWAEGSATFISQLEAIQTRRVRKLKPGRPAKTAPVAPPSV
jgi:putative transposase